MANKKISELDETRDVEDDDIFPTAKGGANEQASALEIAEYVLDKVGLIPGGGIDGGEIL